MYHSTVSARVDRSVGDCWFPDGNWSGCDQDLRTPEGRSPERGEGENRVENL